jgi:UPF0755 protein
LPASTSSYVWQGSGLFALALLFYFCPIQYGIIRDMLRKIIALIVLIVVILGVIQLWQVYRRAQERKTARLEQAQQKMEEVQVTTIEGWTLEEIGKELEEKGLITAAQFKKDLESFDLKDYPLIQSAKPAKTDLEGFLFPDTYRFNKVTTGEMIISKMLDNFVNRVETLGVKPGQGRYRVPGYDDVSVGTEPAGLTFYQLLILSSIIERESAGASERPTIAGIYYNRLGRGQALQSDSTINYVTGKSTPGVSADDLELNSPYNTYKYPGLPPGPISNPSLSSMASALKPQVTDFNYFFHKQPSGEAVFSKTFEEHKQRRIEAGQ